jgi:uncharacterized membrane protein
MSGPMPSTGSTVSHPPLPDDAYQRMAVVLRGGLFTSIAILLVALVVYLLEYPNVDSGSVTSSNPIVTYLSLGGLGHGLATGAPEAYLALGVFVLIATPVLRVATGVYYFHRNGERTMTWVTLTVLVLLILGVLVIGPLVR